MATSPHDHGHDVPKPADFPVEPDEGPFEPTEPDAEPPQAPHV